MKSTPSRIVLAALLVVTTAGCCSQATKGGISSQEIATLCKAAPFEMQAPALPRIPDRSVSLADFGGVGDGVTLNTEAFAKAIAYLTGQNDGTTICEGKARRTAQGKEQGGWVNVPAGIWLTGPVTLQSHIGLRLNDDAVVVFSSDQDLYPIIDTNFEGLDVRRCVSPLNATGVHDIAITGGGIFDGSGDAWREVKKR